MSSQTDPSDSSGITDPVSSGRKAVEQGDIAIVGMACRFPGAGNCDEFWQSMCRGVFSVKEVPQDRWSTDKYYSSNREDENKTVSKWGGFIEDIDKFDAALFRVSPREAELMDPQQRIMLELAWSCIEDAGYAPSDLRGTDTGVYIGVCNHDYKVMVEQSTSSVEAHISTGVHTTLIPNRISFEFDLRGPSIPIDTACSSSLVALEQAVQALRRGDCSAALVGGVSVLCSPTHFISFSKAGMLSPHGVCRSFDERADGYVRGEGAGLILLKPLRQALRNNDKVYGLVKGLAVNHGGRVATLTSPNPFAQSKVVMKAFDDAGISPATVNYIEAHGTGTPKGDPIEMNALMRAYASLAKAHGIALPERSCGIGSVKTNIGHLEAAAGIAGVIKVLLAMRHGSLPNLLHFERLNPRIRLEGSPFYFVTEPQSWAPGTDGVRRAGVSSFGFGGVNAHVLLEDYAAHSPGAAGAHDVPDPGQALLFVVSAKTGDSLARYAKCLADCLEAPAGMTSDPLFSLEALAYSLQKREAMDERLALEALSVDELVRKLRGFADGQKADGCWSGNAKSGRDFADWIKSDDMTEVVKGWLVDRNSRRLGELWVKGVALPDWDLYYAGTRTGKPPAKLRLPTYQFTRKRYWFADAATAGSEDPGSGPESGAAVPAHLHPLVQKNTSTLSEQRFSATFTGDEFFLRDHQVDGARVLPGVAYLEMAQTAMRLASASGSGAAALQAQFKNVVWARPLVVRDTPVEVHIGLYPQRSGGQDGGFVAYEVYSGPADDGPTVHSQGKIRLMAAQRAPIVDLSGLQSRLKGGERSVDDHYALFAAMGISYGPAHRGIERIWVGEDGESAGEVLARVVVPGTVAPTKARFVLHPSLLDAALQAALALGGTAHGVTDPVAARRPLVPFAADSLEVSPAAFGAEASGAAPASLWAWVRPALPGRAARTSAPVSSFEARLAVPFDIDLCDDEGRVHLVIRGLSFRSAGAGNGAGFAAPAETTGLLLMKPGWNADRPGAAATPAPTFHEHRVLFAGFEGADASFAADAIASLRALDTARDGPRLVVENLDAAVREALPQTGEAAFAPRLRARAVRLFERVQEMVRAAAGAPGPQLVQVVVPSEGKAQLHAALSGLLKTARQECPKLVAQVLAIGADTAGNRLLDHLFDSARQADVCEFRYDRGHCRVAELSEIHESAPGRPGAGSDGPWKEGGVYLITGGAGGLGRIFAREICGRLQRVTLVLTGRSLPSTDADADFRRLRRDGVTVEYRRLDVGDAQAVGVLVRDVLQRHGSLNGVIHCAGLCRDNYISKKNAAEFAGVLVPKIDGTIHLDEATREVPLDLFVMFSSTAGALGNLGQADYATANAFMDNFARHRHSLRGTAGVGGAPGRSGRTLSINWPLWQEGGMTVDAATGQLLNDRMGMVALRTSSGIDAFYRALASNEPQVLVMEGCVSRIRRRLLSLPQPQPQPVPQPQPQPVPLPQRAGVAEAPSQTGDSLDRIQATLLHIAAKLLKLTPDDFDTRTPLSEYGFDSIAYTGLASRIGEKYGIEIAPTVFFDYPTVEGIARYLRDEYRDHVDSPAGPARAPIEAAVPHDLQDVHGQPVGAAGREPAQRARFECAAEGTPAALAPCGGDASARAGGAVAIVGMSGSFPMAPDLEAFWDNLQQGKDCISEIPKQRWDWQSIQGDPSDDRSTASVKWGGFIEGVDEFDPLFFGISPREAMMMDPQQRLLMTHVWRAIEDAGYSASSLSGSNTGIFVGTASTGYSDLIARSALPIEGFSATGVVPSVGPNRMSFLLNLHGPSEPVETACSSSLVAIHRAVSAMEVGDCDQAIVGGVNTLVAPDLHISFSKAGMLAHDGRCKTFSKDANGYVRGEGVGMLFLKRLHAAEAAGDRIYGVIRGSAENHGGRANSLTSPNSKSQADVLIKAYRKAGIDARTVTYLEAHGTGTALGDPVEINGIKSAFKTLRDTAGGPDPGPARCALASVKTNIGHLELAAGVAGIIKVLLQFRHRRIVASLHCSELNPHIDLSGTPFYVPHEAQAWTALCDADGNEIPRRAGVSSFGFGGVNAHVVLEEYVAQPLPPRTCQGPVMVPLSARNAAGLRRRAESLCKFLADTPAVPLRDLAYTLQVGRDAMEERLGLVVQTVQDLQSKLRAFLDGREDVDDLYLGQVGRNRDTLAAYLDDEDLQATMQVWLGKAKYAKFFGLWVKGVSFDWNRLHAGDRAAGDLPRRIGLPTYPFSRERFWAGSPASRAPLPGASDDRREPDQAAPAARSQPEDFVLETLKSLERGALSVEDALAAVSAE